MKLKIPGSKSIANRALVLSFLTGNKTTLLNLPDCDDTKLMIEGLSRLASDSDNVEIDVGDAGTVARFLTALSVISGKTVKIDGSLRMRQRPMDDLFSALSKLGGKIEGSDGKFPVKIFPSIFEGGEISVRGDISSQYLSSILMVAPFSKKGVTLNVEQKLCSTPYVEMTINMMKDFGFDVVNDDFRSFRVPSIKTSLIEVPSTKAPSIKFPTAIDFAPLDKYYIEPDASSASYWGAFVALRPDCEVTLVGLNKKSIQGDIKFFSYLEKMGCKVDEEDEGVTVHGAKNLMALGEIDMNETPDLVMTFAVLSAFTEGKTIIRNVENLRFKECDRLNALETELRKIGVNVGVGKDFISVEGDVRKNFSSALKSSSLKEVNIDTYNDHRMAMSFSVIDGLLPNVVLKIKNSDCVSKSYTTFWDDFRKINVFDIVLVGLRGSGKTTIGKILAEKMGRDFIDLDDEFEKNANMEIKDIVKTFGWDYFRDLERDVVKGISKRKGIVIATGGGTVLYSNNRMNLKKNGRIIYLNVTPEECIRRIEDFDSRPALKEGKSPIDEFFEVYAERDPVYKDCADIVFESVGTPEEDASKIIRFFDVRG